MCLRLVLLCQVQWQGSVHEAARSSYLLAVLGALSFALLTHKTRRVPLFNAVISRGHWTPLCIPASLLLFPPFLACGPLLVYSR